MINKVRNRIVFKQARFVLVISLLLGFVFTSLQLFLDLTQERKQLVADVDRVINSHKETAILAIYNLNKGQAFQLTKTLISLPEIYQAFLVDDFGEVLAESRRLPLSNNYLVILGEALFKIPEKVETPLQINGVEHRVAKLVINFDSAYISSAFAQRAITNLVFSLIYNLVLLTVLILLFYRYLSRPIMSISHWVEQLRQGNVIKKLPYTEADEIGDLVSSFASVWQERNQVAEQLYETVQELSKSEHFSRSLMDNAGDAMFLCKPDSEIVQVNLQAAQSLGGEKEQLLGKKLSCFSTRYTETSLMTLFDSFKAQKIVEFEDQQQGLGGAGGPIEARGIKLELHNQSYILIMARDISARKETERQIHKLAFYDALTELPNRRLFIDRLDSALQIHRSNANYGAVLYLDLDRFKTINDSLGHSVGDVLLRQIAERLTDILPDKSTCSRFGGDEFVVLLPQVATQAELSSEIVANIAVEILEKLGAPFDACGHTLYCTASIGIAMFPKQSENSGDILRCADTALYRVKALGRNGFQFFDPEMQSSAMQRLDVEKGLHQALENDEFELVFQPQVKRNGQMIGVEALIRWNHPDKGVLMPGDFISIAEDSGQIIEVGKWVLSNALQQLKDWISAGLPEGFKRLAVNVSPIQFMQVDFVDHLVTKMEELQVPGNMLELEITENTLVNNFDIASSKMKLLKLQGVSFSIDDFGTGYSSLRYLQYLPLDILKIDRSFIINLRLDSDEAAIIDVIIATADRLGLTVIAEGVETLEECQALQAMGCFCYQGYYFSKPIAAKALYDTWCKAA